MNKLKNLALLGVTTLASLCFPALSQATVVTFDDLPQNFIPSSYAGFTWGPNWYADSSAIDAGARPSGSNAAWNAYGVTSVSTTSGSDFDFTGAYFAPWANGGFQSYSSTSVTLEGYNNGVLLYSSFHSFGNSTAWQWVGVSFTGIDEVRVLNSGGTRWWQMDNFTYNESVPEGGSSVLLLGCALLGLGAVRQMRRSVR